MTAAALGPSSQVLDTASNLWVTQYCLLNGLGGVVFGYLLKGVLK